MNNGAIVDGIRRARKLLERAGIEFSLNTGRPDSLITPSKFSEDFIMVSQDEDYDKIHKTALENADYDILISDYSFFQFSLDAAGVIRYAYYQSARKVPTYDEFLKANDLSKDESYAEGERLFSAEYDQLVSEAKLNNSVTPVRYDYNEEQYDGILHPISHLHVGHENEIRIPLNMVLTPQAFIAFILRHIYYEKWKTAVQNDPEFLNEYLVFKNSCLAISDSEKFNIDEKKDLHLA
ncbi:DUF2290 domain-containing protein [Bacillus anthracis]|uniref:DUF2290 domain-containing protein n=1 Tax=Bacillus cereus group sp. MYBK34-1 TaxID=3450631 RepID=UPI002A1BA2EF|nr:DUF2290 domain-containing protein [Bacillus anthracis]